MGAAPARRTRGAAGEAGEQGDRGSPDTPQQVRDKLRQVDGGGSGIDADLLDGINSAGFVRWNVRGGGNIDANGSVRARSDLFASRDLNVSRNGSVSGTLSVGTLNTRSHANVAGTVNINAGTGAQQFTFSSGRNNWGMNGNGVVNRIWSRSPLVLDSNGYGAVYTIGSLFVGGGQNRSIGDLRVTRDGTFNRNLAVLGSANVRRDMVVGGRLTVSGEMSINGNFTAATITARTQFQTNGVTIQGSRGYNYFRTRETGNLLRVGSAWSIPGIYSERTHLVLGAQSGWTYVGPDGAGQNLRVNGILRMRNTNVIDVNGNWIGRAIAAARVTVRGGACPANQFVRQLNANGTVTCAAPAAPQQNCSVGRFGGVCVIHLSPACIRGGSARDYCRARQGRLIYHAEFVTVTRSGWSRPNGSYHTESVDRYNRCGNGVGNVGIPGWGNLNHFNCGDVQGYCNRSIMCVSAGGGGAPPPPANCGVGAFGGVCVNHLSVPCVRGSAQGYCRANNRGTLITFAQFSTVTRSGWRRPNGSYHTEAVDRYNRCGNGVGNVGIPGWGNLNHFNCGDNHNYCNRSIMCVRN